jgi:hypothetical protein
MEISFVSRFALTYPEANGRRRNGKSHDYYYDPFSS